MAVLQKNGMVSANASVNFCIFVSFLVNLVNLGCSNPPHGFLEEKCGRILWCFRECLAEILLLWDYRLEDILIRASYFLARIQIAL